MAVGTPGVCVIHSAGAQRTWTQGVARQAAELHVLKRGGDIVRGRGALEATEPPVRKKRIVIVAAAGGRFKEPPYFDPAPVTNCPSRGSSWNRSRRILCTQCMRGRRDQRDGQEARAH